MASPALYKDLSPPDLTAHRRSGSVAMARTRLRTGSASCTFRIASAFFFSCCLVQRFVST